MKELSYVVLEKNEFKQQAESGLDFLWPPWNIERGVPAPSKSFLVPHEQQQRKSEVTQQLKHSNIYLHLYQ